MRKSLTELLRGQHTPLTDADADSFRAAGFWQDRTLRSLLSDKARDIPDRTALVGRRADAPTTRWNYRQFDAAAHHAANALRNLGVGPGDAVALMLPNWVEYAALVFGTNELGAVYAGIPVAYGERQAAAIIRRSKAKVLVIPGSWRGTNHLELSRALRAEIPTLEHVVVLDDDPTGLRDGEVLWSSLHDVPAHEIEQPDPGEICYLGFTSGTTGEPKGAMHTHDTLLYGTAAIAGHLGSETLGDPMVHLVASPLGHHTGFEFGILLTAYLGGTGVYLDRWDSRWGAAVIREENVTTFFGAPAFLQDMMRTDLVGDAGCPLECLVIAGAPIPRTLPAKAEQALGAFVCPAWGLTECSIMSACPPSEPKEILRTDGSIFAGSAVRIVGQDDDEVPAGVTGELLMRGPGVTLGYYDRPDATDESFLPGLWFRTGDLADVDEHGWLSLRGRSKDIIIRGGENIPVTDVETHLFDHPDVLNAALVAYPDDRLGERACAVLVLRSGAVLDLPGLCEHLLEQGLSKHYLPERLVLVDEMPTTQSGKIQKFKLRELAAAGN